MNYDWDSGLQCMIMPRGTMRGLPSNCSVGILASVSEALGILSADCRKLPEVLPPSVLKYKDKKVKSLEDYFDLPTVSMSFLAAPIDIANLALIEKTIYRKITTCEGGTDFVGNDNYPVRTWILTARQKATATYPFMQWISSHAHLVGESVMSPPTAGAHGGMMQVLTLSADEKRMKKAIDLALKDCQKMVDKLLSLEDVVITETETNQYDNLWSCEVYE
jgi:hypothetical protein